MNKSSKSEYMGIVPIEMELILEQTRQAVIGNVEVFWKMETLFSWEEIIEIQPLEIHTVIGEEVQGDLVRYTDDVQRNTMDLHVARGEELINLEQSAMKAQTTFRVTVDGLPVMPRDPYAYVEAALQAPPSPDYVPGPEHPPSPAYPLLVSVSPAADSLGYISESDPEEEPKEDPEEDDEDPEEDPADYPTDREDDNDEEESSEDDTDDEEEDEEEEEEHPTLANSVPPPVHCLLSPPLPISPPPLPASPTYSLSYRAAMIRLRAESPSTFHPLPSSTPPLGTPPFLPIPLPTSPPPFLLPSTSRRADVPEVTLPPQKRLCIALGLRFKVDESSSAPTTRPTEGFRADYGFVGTSNDEIRRDPKRERERGYGITYTCDEMVEDMQGTPTATDVAGLSQRMIDFIMTIGRDTDEIYERLDDAQDDSNCTMENQIKFATCTVLGSALTWWNSHDKTVGPDVSYAMNWTKLKKKMTDKYYPRSEIKKPEVEVWNLKVKGTDVNIGRAYTAGSGEKKPYGGSKPLCSKCNYHHDAKVYAVDHAWTNPDSNVVTGPELDDHARTFSSLLQAEIDKRNLNPLMQMRVIEQLRQ
uniref:Reverse transcriptase domain-containing protein n=1 Tax=Tanacetum cinerariifolium TaxID=118510 RepID=A0A6L2KCB5_TANCI|nr:reverse transcriptase domain-containing protein [Tanacetum cinerariifolium]